MRSDLPEEFEERWAADEQSAHIVAKFPDEFKHVRLLIEDMKRMEAGKAPMSKGEKEAWLNKTREERLRLVRDFERSVEERREREAKERQEATKRIEVCFSSLLSRPISTCGIDWLQGAFFALLSSSSIDPLQLCFIEIHL